MPMTMIIPNKETMLMDTLKNPANMNIPKKANGKPKATQKANLGLSGREDMSMLPAFLLRKL